jgi:hypothetical protein
MLQSSTRRTPESVDAYIDDIATQAGSIDVVFNLIGPRLAEYGGGKPATQLSVDEFMAPWSGSSNRSSSRRAPRHDIWWSNAQA